MLTQEELKKLLHYDPETGLFTWSKTRAGTARIGTIAGSVREGGGKNYLRVHIKSKRMRAHKLAWLYVYGHLPLCEIDHINGNGLDNRILNLRQVSRIENCRNRRKPKNNTTGVMGVYRDRNTGGFMAQIRHEGRLNYLGSFPDLESAALAREQAEIELGFHENHGSERPL